MPRLLKISELEERRRALAQESDVYRETLKLQIQNLQLYGLRARQRFMTLGPSNPWLRLLGPLFASFIARRGAASEFAKMRFVTGAIFAWKLFKRIASILPGIFGRRKPRNRNREPELA